MEKRVGLILMILSVIIFIIALTGKLNSDNVISIYSNQTGSCYLEGTCLHEQFNITFIVLGIIAGAVFVIGFIIFFLNQKKQEIKQKTIKTTKISLTPEQKRLYNLLKEAGAPMFQGELVEKSGMNKVRVSRVLDKMEMLGVIERRRHGMSNYVLLKSN
jgi:uncharacterized membrane protein